MTRSHLVRTLPVSLGAALLAAAVSLGAASADVVTTRDGLALEGTAAKQADGAWRVETADGVVTLPAASVVNVVAGPGPRAAFLAKAARVPADDAAGQYRLGLEAESAGLRDLARAALERVVKVDPDHAAARRALGQEKVGAEWLAQDEARRRRGLVLYGGRWLLPQEVEAVVAVEPAKAAGDDANVRAWVRATGSDVAAVARAAEVALAAVAPERQVAAGLAVLLERDPAARRAAARFLARLGDESALRALILSGARDVDASVRREAVLAAQSFGNDDVTVPFVRALGSSNPRTAANGAEAIALLGDVRAAPYVMKRLVGHGASARSFVSFTHQVSYVRDYDVEIAQASNIANPNVATLQEGTVLDAHVLDAWYERSWMEAVLLGSLSRLAGRELRSREDALAWWEGAKDGIPAFPEAPAKSRARGKT